MSSYFGGLKIGDLAFISHKSYWGYSKNKKYIILDKNFLFEKETCYGIRRFYEYEVMCIERNKLDKLKTQDIRVHKRIESRKH